MIERIDHTDQGLSVWYSNTEPLVLPWFWIRDHSEDETAYDAATMQRTVDSFSIDRTQRPVSSELVGDEIRVDWGDGSAVSVLSNSTLDAIAPESDPPRLWRSAKGADAPIVPYEDIMDSTDGLKQWLTSLKQFGFGLASGVPPTEQAAQQLAERVGYVRRTVFGDMWTLSSEIIAHADSAYSDSYLEPHTDGSYSHDGPGLQLFACVERTGQGGESVLVDGFAAAEDLRAIDPAAFQVLTEVSVPAHYIEPNVELRASRPTIRLDTAGRVEQVTFNNYDRSPFLLEPDAMEAWYRAYSAFHALIIDQSTWWTRKLEAGDALLFDNWRCLHGRLAYTGRRVFNGCYLNHEDLESRIRVS